jgi:hypothetical protein
VLFGHLLWHSTISLEDIWFAQYYILREQLLKLRELKWRLEENGIDFFNLDGFVRMTLDNMPSIVDLLPPVIEETITKSGRVINVINDGMHRLYIANLEWTIPRVIYIRGIPKELYYYSHPIPYQDWSKVEILKSISPNFLKKWHRTEQNKKLFRNFNSQFENVGTSRGYS